MTIFPSQIHAEARALFLEWYGDALAEQGACLYWGQVAMRSLLKAGLNPILQAGDLHWPIVRPENDDGVRPTHFSYEWSPEEPISAEALAQGQVPEVHVWCGLILTTGKPILVDFSTGYLKQLAEDRHGLTWETEPPPPYIFGAPPPGVIYRPRRDATLWAWRHIVGRMAQRPDLLNLIPV